MRLLGTRPRLLALGEPTHGAETLLGLRNELFRQLVEREGYRTIALEVDCLGGLLVDDYITRAGDPDLGLDEVMERGFSHEWGAFPGNRELVRWMRAHNEGLPAPDRVRFAGFDGPLEITGGASPRPVLTALHEYLSARVDADLLPCTAEALDRMIGADARWTDPDAMLDPSRSVGQSAEARELRLLADDLVALLDAQAPHLIATSSPEAWERVRLFGRTATGLLRYHFWLADTSPGRMTWLLGVRDAMMAANLHALAERAPTLAYGHNSHLQRSPSEMTMWGHPRLEWWGAGALVSARAGAGYGFLATALGTIPEHGVGAPAPDTVEGMLYAQLQEAQLQEAPLDETLLDEILPRAGAVVDAPRLAAALGAPPPARVSPWYGYAPLSPAHLAKADGIVFVKDVLQR